MNRLFLYPHEITNLHDSNTISIEDPVRLGHVRDILKSQVGDEIKVVAIDHGLGHAQILELDESVLKLRLSPLVPGEKNNFCDEIWVGACRPPTVKKVLEYATSMGVGKIRFFKTELSEKSYLSSKVFEAPIGHQHLAFGLAQSDLYFQMPHVVVSPYFPSQPPSTPAFLFSLSGKKNLYSTDIRPCNQSITLVFGPERGLTPREETQFVQMGMTPLNIHPATLRIEVAVISALSQLHARRSFLA